MGIDDFLSKLPAGWVDLGFATGPGEYAHDGLRFEMTPTGRVLRVGDTCRRLLRAYHQAAAAASRSGLDVIVDDVVVDKAILRDWIDALDELRPTWVAVRCAPEIAVQREQARGDRPIGMTSTQTTSVHRSVSYAFEIDTGELTPDEALTELCVGLGL